MQLNSIFNSAPLIMMLIDEMNVVLKINKFGIEATGRDNGKLDGLKPGDVIKCIHSNVSLGGCGYDSNCENCILRKTIDETFKTGKEHYKIESNLTTKENGKEKSSTILISTSIVTKNPEKQLLITIDDITDRKQLEHDLIKARDKAEESDNLKSAFLANISHEIRTPMNGIMGFSDMLTNPNLSEEKRKQFSLLIQDGCRQLLGIITDVIDISMLDSRQVSIVDSEFSLNDFMQELFLMYRQVANNKNINLFYNNGFTKLKILTDREKLKHVFSNLISNAIKFTDNGRIEFGFVLNDKEIEFYVSDTGIGIAASFHDAIFERFRQVETSDTRNYNGAGLGLSIAKGLVNLLGGKIWLKSKTGQGTTFYFSIPARIVEKDSWLTSENFSGLQNLHENEILIAEDDEINFLFMQEVLNEINLYPMHAKNGAEAVTLFRKYPSVKLILMDIKMPVMDGFEATRSIREFDAGVPIIAQTAYTLPGNIRELSKSGFNGIISKPIDKEKLEWLVMQYLY
ncbi:MAG TPA: ATP-binding protein [Bacteroidales bacterium]|nr:ATP-binding protein [Bacteroidales bacterium]